MSDDDRKPAPHLERIPKEVSLRARVRMLEAIAFASETGGSAFEELEKDE